MGKFMRTLGRISSTTITKAKKVKPSIKSTVRQAIKDYKVGFNSVKHSG